MKVQAFCQDKGLPLLAEIPFRRDIAEHYAHGGVLAQLDPGMQATFEDLAEKLEGMALAEVSLA